METVKLAIMPKCCLCAQEAEYDSPIDGRSWGYLCPVCMTTHGSASAGTRLEQQPVQQPLQQPVYGIEATPIEKVVLEGSNRMIKCPVCSDQRHVEPDAGYDYLCVCGTRVQVPEPFC